MKFFGFCGWGTGWGKKRRGGDGGMEGLRGYFGGWRGDGRIESLRGYVSGWRGD